MKKIILFLSLILTLSLVGNKIAIKTQAQSIDHSCFSSVAEYTPIHKLNSIELLSFSNADGGFVIGGEYISVQLSTVTTPNRTNVEVYKVLNDISDDLVSEFNSIVASQYPNSIRLGNATAKYNCHSYAWYSQSSSNSYWMNYPSPYYEDNSYLEVSTPMQGDIICYFDDNGTSNNYADDSNLHSGIVVSYDSSISSNGVCGNSNQVVVKSKWGAYGLYQHRGDQCPYTSADYVKYYRRHYHSYEDHYCTGCNDYTTSHDYHDPYTWVDYNQHKATCGCGATTQQGHVVSSNAFSGGKRYATCLICGGLAERGFVQLNASSAKVQYVTDNGSYILPNGVIVLVDEDIELYLNSTLEFHKNDSQLLIE